MTYSPQEAYGIAQRKIWNAATRKEKIIYLGGLGLETLPPELWNLVNLTSLDFHGNLIKILPAAIGKLVNLSSLEIHNNQITALPPELGLLKKLTTLSLSNNNLTSLPYEIGQLVNLTSLGIRENQLTSLPVSIGQLFNLVSLYISGNQLENLPAQIIQLTKLTDIELHNNQINALPNDFGKLNNLITLNLSRNNIKTLPVSIRNLKNLKSIKLEDNPLSLPPEIVNKSDLPNAIFEYYFSLYKKALNECKVLVVGQGSVGKTSLVQRLVLNKFNPAESKTEGISITHWEIENSHSNPINDHSKINLNIWDFGGQEIMHATHQFFLTKRSLYLLILDSRLTQEENRVEYWLKIIQSFGGESPVIVVGNKTDEHPLDIDRTGLKKKYPNILGIFESSAKTGTGISILRSEIVRQIHNLPHVRDLLPESWFKVKKNLEELGRTKNFIHHHEFLAMCKNNDIGEEDSQRTLIGFMHDLGIILHFQDDPRLEALGILNPQWVTNGVYKILNSHELFQNRGMLTISMLNTILNLPEYPHDKRLFIVDMMKKFELCYDVQTDKTFLVPDLLPKNEPFTGEWNDALAFQYHYTVLPSSVITRFIVRMNEYIYRTVWRSGVVLKGYAGKPQGSGNTALIKADMEDKKIYIWVNGNQNTRRDFLSAIRGQFDAIHQTITRLEVREKVPVPGQDEVVVDFEHLITLERKGIDKFIPEGMEDTVMVRQLLNGVANSASLQRSNITNIYIDGDIKEGNLIVGDSNNISKNK